MTLDDLIWEFFNETKTEGIRFPLFSREYGYRQYRMPLDTVRFVEFKQAHVVAETDNTVHDVIIYSIVINRSQMVCTCDTRETALMLKEYLTEKIPIYQLVLV